MPESDVRHAVDVFFVVPRRKTETDDLAILNSDEHVRAARFARDADRMAFVGTRAALRRIVGSRIGIAPQAVRLTRSTQGKPVLCASHGRSDLSFSVSHADGLSAIAMSCTGSVGIDLERRRAVPERTRITAELFGEEAADDLARRPAAVRDAAFLRLWSAGEAWLKATGLGFAGHFIAGHSGLLPLRLSPDGTTVTARTSAGEEDQWCFRLIERPDHVGCVALSTRPSRPSPKRRQSPSSE